MKKRKRKRKKKRMKTKTRKMLKVTAKAMLTRALMKVAMINELQSDPANEAKRICCNLSETRFHALDKACNHISLVFLF